MPEVEVEYHRLAIRDGKDAHDWYAERSSRASEKFEARIRQAIGEVQ